MLPLCNARHYTTFIHNHTQVGMCTMYQDVYVLQHVYSLIYIDRSFRSLEAYITSITLCIRTRDSIHTQGIAVASVWQREAIIRFTLMP